MSVATGIAPRELLDLDAETFSALQEELAQRWSEELELAAVSAEIQHAHLLAFLRVHAKKGARLPDVLQVPRPEREKAAEPRPRPVSLGQLTRLANTAELVEARRAG